MQNEIDSLIQHLAQSCGASAEAVKQMAEMTINCMKRDGAVEFMTAGSEGVELSCAYLAEATRVNRQMSIAAVSSNKFAAQMLEMLKA